MIASLVEFAEWGFLLYFLVLNTAYLGLTVTSFVSLWRCLQRRVLEDLPQIYSGLESPISIIVPAHNEQATIVTSVRSLLQLNYPEFEIIVVNDGSTDGTLDALRRELTLVPMPEAFRVRVPTRPVRAVYQSVVYPQLRVIDKENGGKADALNAGINGSRYPLFCSLDADSVLQRDSLQRVVLPFLEDPHTVAAGGIVRVANGCEVSAGVLVRSGLPRNPLALIQVVEYLRAFLFGRLGWSAINSVLVISGAFGLFHKDTVIAAGGYRTDTVGEDMDLVVRLHRMLRQSGRPCRIAFVPDPVCWTEAPESWRVLRAQRIRWQRGLAESLSANIGLVTARNRGAAGWLAFPFALVFECASPILEVLGYAFFVVGSLTGFVSREFAVAFLMVAVGFGTLQSVSALLLEQISFQLYPRMRDVLLLFVAVFAENFGYRQATAWWRLVGLWKWAMRRQARWGEMTRTASWEHKPVEVKR